MKMATVNVSRALATFRRNNPIHSPRQEVKPQITLQNQNFESIWNYIGKSISLLYHEQEPSTLGTLSTTARTVMVHTKPWASQHTILHLWLWYSYAISCYTHSEGQNWWILTRATCFIEYQRKKFLAAELTWKMPPSDYRRNTGDSHGEWNAHKVLHWPFECTGTHRTSAQGILQKT